MATIIIFGVIIIFKRMKLDKQYFKIALYAFIVLGSLILLENVIKNLGFLSSSLYVILAAVNQMIVPFIIGFSIAYLINPGAMFLERKLFKNTTAYDKYPTAKRVIPILIAYILVFGCVTWILIYFIPEIKTTLTNFFYQLPRQQAALENTINSVFNNIDYINAADVNAFVDTLLEPIFNASPAAAPKVLQAIFDSTVFAASTLLNLVLGIFISFYMLADKHKSKAFIRKTMYAIFPEQGTSQFLYGLSEIHRLFQNFIVGKTIDSTIIGILCFAGMSLMNAPYVLIISLIVGITNMIPYFGPFIGAIPAILMTLLIDPSKAIWVALFILALQQFDGIILGPKILGDSTGLTPLLIIFAIIVGGALLGPLGMFLGVPLLASAKLFFTSYVDQRYQKKYSADEQNLESNHTEINKEG